ncbi:putative zinc-binding metallopeptidase [Algoriphagus namhaensis]|uniref:Zinc-binding metallopeptidase n=1 Tax=Algoriphagus namhaensis TaxID=915353 RepID=A0ABV8ASQ4_9BACT
MKVFQCGHCQHPLFFESYSCENCGHESGYRSMDRMMLTFDPAHREQVSDREGIRYKYCKNHHFDVCNWVVPAEEANDFCEACQLNRTIPNLSNEKNLEKWRNLEVAKHRLVYQLQKLGLNLPSKMQDPNGLCFDFVARQHNKSLMTGHASGVITILLREADSVLREQARLQMGEPYRTLIGHLRHEVGHYFWDRLVLPHTELLVEFRTIFGDERKDYGTALAEYYKTGAPVEWQENFISKYATSHPWEDWAETWAHYLHLMDMVETAHFFGLKVDPFHKQKSMRAKVTFDPYGEKSFKKIVNAAVPISFAVNSINRAMGIPDVYPFVINHGVVKKMSFIHSLMLSAQLY